MDQSLNITDEILLNINDTKSLMYNIIDMHNNELDNFLFHLDYHYFTINSN